MHCLITGAAGFIGSNLVERLLGDGVWITAVDNFDPFYPRAVKEANLAGVFRDSRLRFVEADIRDTQALRRLRDGYDCIIHLAAKVGVRPSIADPVAYEQVNVAGTQNLLEAARAWAVRQFVFASSSSVYGVNPKRPWSEDDHVLLPISPYAATKVSGELLGHVYSHLYGIRFLALRFFTVYGPRQRPDLAIHKFAKSILAGQPITIFGDGSTTRDYTYVGDIVSGIRSAIDYSGGAYQVINLGNNRPTGLLEMVHALESVLNKRAILDFLPEQPGDVPWTSADIRKAKDLLNYEPKTSFTEGLARFVAQIPARQIHSQVPTGNSRSTANLS